MSMDTLDEMLHQRASSGKRNLIAGWNVPEGAFKFEVGQELASDSHSAFPLLHQRARHPDMSIQIGVKA